jgi:hypothetical protein
VEVAIRFGGAVFPFEGIHSGDDLVREATKSYRALVQKGGEHFLFDLPD